MTAIAHVGHGYWGKNIARNFHELGHLVAVVDPDARAAQAAASAYGVRALSFEAALADLGIDAVSLASPAILHFSQAKAALEAGKHVYVEKPLALDVAEAEQLRALAEARGLTLMVGHLLQYHPVYLALRGMVEAGELGRHISWGPGPRASQALMLAVRARALLDGRYAPSLDDVAALAEPVLKHRMALTFAARAEGETVGNVIKRLKSRIG